MIKGKLILGHSEPITKEELNEIFKKEDSMCIIYSKNKSGMGFFLNLNENYLLIKLILYIKIKKR